MKKFINYWLMAALVCGLGMSVTSCKDDDDDNNGGKTQEQQASKAMKFYKVVSHLADLSAMDDDNYQSQTFEPIIGEESQNDQMTRIVVTNDMETAAARFADIIGLNVGTGFPVSTSSYNYNDPDVGTLTYTKSNDGKSWAEVEVNIKQVPHLEKIVYCTPEQVGENASFFGTAYYRFGDVISREYTSKKGNKSTCTEYWICVRPAFGREGKGDTHWISVGQLPEDNIFHHSGSNGTEYYVPTKVCDDKENMQNFAEMLYAMFEPELWWKNLTYPGIKHPKVFWDFHVDSLKYHNQYFWQNVRKGWEEAGIAQKAFNMNSMAELEEVLHEDGLNLLYSGYSWITTFSWYCELYNINYSSGDGEEANFHKVKKETIEKNMKDIHFDCRKMGQDIVQYREFFGDNDNTKRWVVRYAKGKQLMASGTFNKFEGIVGCNDVWNYNKAYGPFQNLSNEPPQETKPIDNSAEPVIGSILSSDGKFYNSVNAAKSNGREALAIVVALNGKKSVEKGSRYNGLAAYLGRRTMSSWFEGETADCGLEPATDNASLTTKHLNGISNTRTLANGCGKNHVHNAAKNCSEGLTSLTDKGFSQWFLPSAGQWVLALKSLGYSWDYEKGWNYPGFDSSKLTLESNAAQKIFSDHGATMGLLSYNCWTSTPADKVNGQFTKAISFSFSYQPTETNKPCAETFVMPFYPMPFIAFQYNGGATED